ncbi:MAG: MoxR family ATPase [Ruminococcaceae bacterium]|nr:MoxR family ATPase [Oscillospiraceae bacterium]
MDAVNCLQNIRKNMQQVVVGKEEVIDRLLIALICSGHVLVEDLPGLGKTTLVSALASSLGCGFQRIQFTPDVLPSDITGFNMYQLQTGEQVFHPGSIHNQIILADEINRASPKTQSALLEAMQERQVTVDGTTYELPKPFMVLATQNPVEMAGTYPLPEAQMDRFLMRIRMGYPSHEEEMAIVRGHRSVTEAPRLSPVASAEDILRIQASLSSIHVDEAVLDYIVQIVEGTRTTEGVLMGVSPRGSIALTQAACAKAILMGRDYVLPDDVKQMAECVLSHRIVMKNRSGAEGTTAADVVAAVLETVKVPKIK